MASVRPRGRASAVAKRTATFAVAAAAALVVVAGCASGAGAGRGASGHGSGGASGRSPVQEAYEAAVRKVLPSVVEISAGGTTGSGVVYDSRGDIVTNAHVIGNRKDFTVLTSVLSEPVKAHLIGLFAPDDLAVIRVDRDQASLRPVHWANSARVQVGDIVLAMGNPYGLVDSVTQGIVSATGRAVTGERIKGQPPTAISDAIQTSAAINPGNSGGALVLLSGRVVGIPTLSAQDPQLGTPAEGIGFAIPSDTVRDIAAQLISRGKVTRSGRASLDITGQTHVSGDEDKPDGVSVDAATRGGAGARAGIRAGDIIVGLGGRATPTLNELEDALLDYRPGQQVKVEVLRDGSPRQFTATLDSLTG
ncbi:MAG TPA: trypsin-like peptidase domain-containing protein [Streptosporangiaceae bacterium]|nr:trypsin-like peptidase domain-containing protein [Streptosporangiaceae bacterium]